MAAVPLLVRARVLSSSLASRADGHTAARWAAAVGSGDRDFSALRFAPVMRDVLAIHTCSAAAHDGLL